MTEEDRVTDTYRVDELADLLYVRMGVNAMALFGRPRIEAAARYADALLAAGQPGPRSVAGVSPTRHLKLVTEILTAPPYSWPAPR